MAGIDRNFLLKFRHGFRDTRFIQIQFPQQEVNQRQIGVHGHRFLRILFGDWVELLAQQHSRREHITGGRIGRDLKHSRESSTRPRIIFGLDIADTEYIRGIHVRPWIPALHLFQQRNRVRRMSSKVIRETKQLRRFSLARIRSRSLLQILDRLGEITFLVVDGAKLQVETFRRWILGL